MAEIILTAFRSGSKLLICGNGGSAADAQHIETEFVSRFMLERKGLNAESLTVNTSSLTAIANDYDFDRVFARQVEAKGQPGDVLLGISTSGSSRNILKALDSAKMMGMLTIGLTGIKKDSEISKRSDHCICVPSVSTPRIQEAHILIGHIVCAYVEERLFGNSDGDLA
jgi:D-sedoheptulose 7-phosphate isomerase